MYESLFRNSDYNNTTFDLKSDFFLFFNQCYNGISFGFIKKISFTGKTTIPQAVTSWFIKKIFKLKTDLKQTQWLS